ncbi:phospholipase D family protein [Halorubellus salinus]|uniref:phospholipase D family protein n=1 Tax=Halorubellus salinus TaxID=755309 RepID=UPI001D060F4E|nr:phospholipase D family protein [Halorubellus salinus]
MASEDSARHVGRLCEDFTIAGAISEAAVLESLCDGFRDIPTDTIDISGQGLIQEITEMTLSQTEQEALLIGLLQTDVADRIGGGHTILEATYRINTTHAVEVLTQQLIAAHALTDDATDSKRRTTVETLATFPVGTSQSPHRPEGVVDLPPRLRRLLLEAKESVRIANPYFDTTPRIIDDILALPRKGVHTAILTRELNHPDHRAVFGRIHETLTAEEEALIDVRELYAQDSSGRQTTATHAKLMVVDDEIAYVGSANLTITSLTSNFELGVIIKGPPVADIAAAFDAIFKDSTEVSIE